jgi:hypothetical protein
MSGLQKGQSGESSRKTRGAMIGEERGAAKLLRVKFASREKRPQKAGKNNWQE